MKIAGTRKPHRLRQSGTAAVEFALIFPIMFAVIYAGLVYGLVYFLQQRVNFAAQEGVRAAIAVDPAAYSDVSKYTAQVSSEVSAAVIRNFVGAGQPATAAPAGLQATMVTTDAAAGTVTVLVGYSLTTPMLFPVITLPLIGVIPALPPVLRATVVGRLS